MREQMQHGLGRPVGLIIVEIVFRKTAHVQNAEMGVDAGPAIGCRLAAIIETRPDESAGRPRTGIIIRPPDFGRRSPAYSAVLDVVSRAITGTGVIRVNAARGHGAGRFCADAALGWIG